MLDKLSSLFSKPTAATPPSATVTAAVKPGASITGKAVLCAGGVLVFVIWLSKSDYQQSQAPAQSKTSSVSVVTPDRSPVFGLSQEKNAAAIDAAVKRQEREMEAQRQASGNPNMASAQYGTGQAGPAETRAQTEKERAAERAEKERERLWAARFAPGLMVAPEAAQASDVSRNALSSPAVAVPPSAGGNQPAGTSVAAAPSQDKAAANRSDCFDQAENGEKLYAICQGTPITAISQIRLTGDFVGPVNAVLDQDVFSRDRQHLLFPKGTAVIGQASAVEKTFQQKLDVKFHRVLLPDGRGYRLNDAPALEPAGDIALKDKVNRHLLSKFSAAVVLGGLAGFSQAGTGSALTGGGLDMYRQGVSAQMGQTGQQIVGQQLNRPNSLTIREGHSLIIYLNEDMHVPDYGVPSVVTRFGEQSK